MELVFFVHCSLVSDNGVRFFVHGSLVSNNGVRFFVLCSLVPDNAVSAPQVIETQLLPEVDAGLYVFCA